MAKVQRAAPEQVLWVAQVQVQVLGPAGAEKARAALAAGNPKCSAVSVFHAGTVEMQVLLRANITCLVHAKPSTLQK